MAAFLLLTSPLPAAVLLWRTRCKGSSALRVLPVTLPKAACDLPSPCPLRLCELPKGSSPTLAPRPPVFCCVSSLLFLF
ncbi:hypothetical protein ACFX1S_033293 [Malus domestica]